MTKEEILDYRKRFRESGGRIPWECVWLCLYCPNPYCIAEGCRKTKTKAVAIKINGERHVYSSVAEASELSGISKATIGKWLKGVMPKTSDLGIEEIKYV